MDNLLTTKEASDKLGVSEQYLIDEIIANRNLPVIFYDTEIFIYSSDLDEWIKKHEKQAEEMLTELANLTQEHNS